MTLDAKDTHARFFMVMLNGEMIQDVKMAYNNPDCDNQGFVEVYAYHKNSHISIKKENGEPATVSLSGRVEFILDMVPNIEPVSSEECVEQSTPDDCVFEAGKTEDQVPRVTGGYATLTDGTILNFHDPESKDCVCVRCLNRSLINKVKQTNTRKG